MSRCPFCDEFVDPSENICKIDRAVLRTENYIVFPTYGCLRVGYLLIVPHNHYLCMGENINPNELDRIISCICMYYRQELNIDNFILFEHGSCEEAVQGRGGNSVYHAHMHIVPWSTSLIHILQNPDIINHYIKNQEDSVRELFDELSLNISEIESFMTLKEIAKTNQTYLFFQDVDKKKYLSLNQRLPSQFMRIIIASQTNQHWDWRVEPYIDMMFESIKRFKSLGEAYVKLDYGKL